MKNYNRSFNDIRHLKQLIEVYKKQKNWPRVDELRHRLKIAIKRTKEFRR